MRWLDTLNSANGGRDKTSSLIKVLRWRLSERDWSNNCRLFSFLIFRYFFPFYFCLIHFFVVGSFRCDATPMPTTCIFVIHEYIADKHGCKWSHIQPEYKPMNKQTFFSIYLFFFCSQYHTHFQRYEKQKVNTNQNINQKLMNISDQRTTWFLCKRWN